MLNIYGVVSGELGVNSPSVLLVLMSRLCVPACPVPESRPVTPYPPRARPPARTHG